MFENRARRRLRLIAARGAVRGAGVSRSRRRCCCREGFHARGVLVAAAYTTFFSDPLDQTVFLRTLRLGV